MLEVLVLGPLLARSQKHEISLGGKKQRDLLALLAMGEGRSRSAKMLIDELWIDPPANPGHALQVHVSRLRQAVPVEIRLDAGGYRLDPSRVELDASQFTDLLAEGTRLLDGSPVQSLRAFDAALDLWRGTVFSDLSDLFALRAEGERLEQARLEAIGGRLDALLMTGSTRAAAGELLTLTTNHPLDERFWAQSLFALYSEGRRSESITVFDRARTTLARGLGAGPGPLLRALYELVLQERPPHELARLLWSAQSPVKGVPPGGTPTDHAAQTSVPPSDLIGRAPELAVLRNAWHKADIGLQIVAISGDAGIGKTRLATEFSRALSQEDAPVLFGRCAQSLQFAYQPFLQMLRLDTAAMHGDELLNRLGPSPEEIVSLLPELADRLPVDLPPPAESVPAADQHQFFRAISGWLERACLDKPACLIVDDLHWADPETIAFLEYLVLDHPRPIRALLVLTFRDRENLLSTKNQDVAVYLRQSEVLNHVPLRTLDVEEITKLVNGEFAHLTPTTPQPADLAARVSAAAGGNPLFAIELARHYAVDGTQPPQEGERTPSSSTPVFGADGNLSGAEDGFDLGLPDGLRAVVLDRLEQFTPEMREQLEFASVLGRNFDPVVLARALNQHVTDLDNLLVTAVHARLIEREHTQNFSFVFCHDVFRMALYDGIAPLRRATIHQAVAKSFEPVLDSSVSSVHALAHHFSEAAPLGHTEDAVRYLAKAGTLYVEQGAPLVAVDLLRRAKVLQPHHATPAERSDLLLNLGVAENRAGLASYRTTLLEAARIAADANDSPRLTAAAIANNRGWYSSTAAPDRERIAIIDAALVSSNADDDVSRARLLASWAIENIRDSEKRERSLAASHEARAIADASNNSQLIAQVLPHHYVVVFGSFSDPRGAVEIAEETWSLALRSADLTLELYAVTALAQATMATGNIVRSDEALARADELCRDMNEPARLWMLRAWRATREALRGDLESAQQLALSALALGTKTGQPDATSWFAGQQFMFKFLVGQLPEVVPAIEQLAAGEDQFLPAWEAAYGAALAESGRLEEAQVILDRFVAEEFAQLPVDMLWLAGMVFLSVTSTVLGDAEAARAVHNALLPHSGLLAHNGTIDAGPVDLHLGATALTYRDWGAAEEFLLSAASWCAHNEAPLWAEYVNRVLKSLESESALEV